MKRLVPTGEMTLGPFFPREFGQGANDLTVLEGKPAKGEVIEITGKVTQGDGAPLDNAILEIWQSNADGRFDDPAFFGWGRAATDASGVYRFRTIRPGARRRSTCCGPPSSEAVSGRRCSGCDGQRSAVSG